MRAASVFLLATLALGGCGDSKPAAPDRPFTALDGQVVTLDGRVADAPASDGPRSEAGRPDAKADAAPKVDSTIKLDSAAKTDAAPKPDATIKMDSAPKLDSAIKTDAAPKLDSAPSACTPNPCLNGGTCVPGGSGYTCACATGWKGTHCQTESYCDVLYRVSGAFHTTNAPVIGEFTRSVGTNATTPPFNPARTTPFTPSAFPSGFMRLRFRNGGSAPASGPVKVIEYFMPMEFSVNTMGTNVSTDVDHSAGLLSLSGTPPVIGDPPTLSRGCTTVASGTLAGTTLTWDTCSAVPNGTTGWNYANAVSNDPGCLHRMSVWGNVSCSGTFCGLTPGLGNQRQTWDQRLNAFTFSGTNLTTATFTMAEVQVPNITGVRTFMALSATSVLKIECDTVQSPLVCDEQ